MNAALRVEKTTTLEVVANWMVSLGGLGFCVFLLLAIFDSSNVAQHAWLFLVWFSLLWSGVLLKNHICNGSAVHGAELTSSRLHCPQANHVRNGFSEDGGTKGPAWSAALRPDEKD